MSLSIINDIHGGVIRSGGATPQTAWLLRLWVIERFKELLAKASGTDLLVLGDLLDTYSIPYLDLLEIIDALVAWLAGNPDSTLFLVPGNHDLSKTTTTMSSFQFLCRLLKANSNRVVILDKPGRVKGHDAYVIPHIINQEQFDIELDKVPDDVANLLVHCNYNNHFAQQADHSLNISEEQAKALPVKRIIFAHEHQRKSALAGKVEIIGNQIPSSVADCLGNNAKYMLEINGGKLVWHETWKAEGSFERIDWHDCMKASADSQFIRVEGEAAASEASAVVSAISKLRSAHKAAFVITNAVKIDGRSSDGEAKSLEAVQSYNIMDALKNRLSPAQWSVVAKLLEENDA
jgi:hypothetical protein